jgi:hypothetical protein
VCVKGARGKIHAQTFQSKHRKARLIFLGALVTHNEECQLKKTRRSLALRVCVREYICEQESSTPPHNGGTPSGGRERKRGLHTYTALANIAASGFGLAALGVCEHDIICSGSFHIFRMTDQRSVAGAQWMRLCRVCVASAI